MATVKGGGAGHGVEVEVVLRDVRDGKVELVVVVEGDVVEAVDVEEVGLVVVLVVEEVVLVRGVRVRQRAASCVLARV